ncbi:MULTISPECIES: hypothetical protein [Nonomuraea]|uniref:DUF11 domain-containing protein n=1 Tax=Nonomuraea mangrovi TaxID=2316207 RepID=A0ABW4SPL6_9ACTN
MSLSGFAQVAREEWVAVEGGAVGVGCVARRTVAVSAAVVVLSGSVPASANAAPGQADLSVKVSASPSVARPGQPIVYRVDVDNAGPGDAVQPVLKVVVPDGVDVVGVDVATCRPGRTLREVVCPSAENVAAGGSGGVTITGLVRRGTAGPLRLVASMSAQRADVDDTDNRATLTTTVDSGADLGLRLRARQARGGFVLAATVNNRGPHVVRDARVEIRADGAHLLAGGSAGGVGNLAGAQTPASPAPVDDEGNAGRDERLDAGESGRGAGESGRGAGESGRGMGESGRGAGESGRGAGESGRGMGESGRGAGESGRGAGESGRGTSQAGAGDGVRVAGDAACRRRAGLVVCEPAKVGSGDRVRFELFFSTSRDVVNVKGAVRSSRFGDRRPADNEADLRVAVR